MLEKTAHCYSSSSFRNSCKITYRLCNSRRLALMAELMSLKWLLHSAASAVKPTAITHVNTWVKVSVQHRSKAYLFHSEKRRMALAELWNNPATPHVPTIRRGSRQPQGFITSICAIDCIVDSPMPMVDVLSHRSIAVNLLLLRLRRRHRRRGGLGGPLPGRRVI